MCAIFNVGQFQGEKIPLWPIKKGQIISSDKNWSLINFKKACLDMRHCTYLWANLTSFYLLKKQAYENFKCFAYHIPIKVILSFGIQESTKAWIKSTVALASVSRLKVQIVDSNVPSISSSLISFVFRNGFENNLRKIREERKYMYFKLVQNVNIWTFWAIIL